MLEGFFLVTGTFAQLFQSTVVDIVQPQLESFNDPIPPIVGPHPEGDGRFFFVYSPPSLFNYSIRGETILGEAVSPFFRALAIRVSYGIPLAVLFATPLVLTAVALCWGLTVVADSGQFSAAASELADPRYVGTVLTVQTGVGFLLTMVSIRLVPSLVDLLGWRYVFMVLAIGPAIGIVSMLRLRRLPAAVKMAGGNR